MNAKNILKTTTTTMQYFGAITMKMYATFKLRNVHLNCAESTNKSVDCDKSIETCLFFLSNLTPCSLSTEKKK